MRTTLYAEVSAEQRAKAGDRIDLDVVVTNHSTKPQPTACRAILPKALGGKPTAWIETEIPEVFLREFAAALEDTSSRLETAGDGAAACAAG